ncbi:MAG: permease-like cell division protein FtsX [Vulcanimicrobiaceae bacterium]
MDWGKVKFFLGEVLRNFTRNAGMQATAIGTVAITIVLLGSFLFVRTALAGLGGQLLDQIEVSIYLKPDATAAQTAAIRSALVKDPRILSVEYVPKKQGLVELRARTKGEIDTALLTENPLPDKFRVKVRDPDNVTAVAVWARGFAGVGNVVYGQDYVQRLLSLGAVLRRVGLGAILVFLIVASIIISNTIRLTVFARRREIAIMQLVGATNMYIRMPFICEGALGGILGGLVAIGILWIARVTLWPRMLEALPWMPLNSASVDPLRLALELLAVGGAIGILASWISVGRHLRT